jgi:arsenate reductase
MIKIYHNPRCRKSREGLAILENSGKEFEIVKYLETIPSLKELTEIIHLLDITPIQLVRKTEKIWKENYKGKEMSDADIIEAITEKAVIGRPPENINTII